VAAAKSFDARLLIGVGGIAQAPIAFQDPPVIVHALAWAGQKISRARKPQVSLSFASYCVFFPFWKLKTDQDFL
jgi:hypothetical protein